MFLQMVRICRTFIIYCLYETFRRQQGCFCPLYSPFSCGKHGRCFCFRPVKRLYLLQLPVYGCSCVVRDESSPAFVAVAADVCGYRTAGSDGYSFAPRPLCRSVCFGPSAFIGVAYRQGVPVPFSAFYRTEQKNNRLAFIV